VATLKTLTNRRQRIRWALVMISFFLFPVTLYYFSPYLIVVGAAEGIVSGSAILFAALVLSGVFFGRGYCAWVCPGAGLQEACYGTCTRPTPLGWPRVINYMIWVVWMLAIIWLFIKVGGILAVEPLYQTASGISVQDFGSLMRYLAIAGSILLMGLFISRRAFCHTLCWMAPFLVIGQKTGRWLGLPQLGLVAKPADCKGCGLCTKSCPMDLPVEELVMNGDMRHVDCINCGRCVDTCKRNTIRFSW
jgi:ferredoxin-type protein NapH